MDISKLEFPASYTNLIRRDASYQSMYFQVDSSLLSGPKTHLKSVLQKFKDGKHFQEVLGFCCRMFFLLNKNLC